MSLENSSSVSLFLWVGKVVPLLLQMSPRPSLTVFKANDSVLNDTKKGSRLSPKLFAIRQSLEAPFSNFSFCFHYHLQIWLRLMDHQMTC